jgi:hypothetical protein
VRDRVAELEGQLVTLEDTENKEGVVPSASSATMSTFTPLHDEESNEGSDSDCNTEPASLKFDRNSPLYASWGLGM